MERLALHHARVRPALPDEAAVDLVFRIEKHGAVSDGTVVLSAGGVSVDRSASSISCADVITALTMMAAIALEEEIALEHEVEPPAAEGEEAPRAPATGQALTTAKAARPPAVRTPRVAAVRRARSERLSAAMGAGFEVNGNRGALPLATWFAQLAFPARFEPMLRLGIARSLRERIVSPLGHVSVRWTELTMSNCVDLLRHDVLRIGPCVNVELGRLEASVVAPLPVVSFSYLWLTLGASARATWRLSPSFSIEMMVGARAPVTRTDLYFEPYEDPVAYRAPRVSPFAAVGFVAHVF
ncbi:hypothetical protein AKJ09_02308 [Labilithrix luteola]|uniref:Uncharacterized protein n=2 Tax=Labilithrix luteola TaxID=1391654 RepID=A0A0K1PRA5_9BACT|nr:hypothetical protein AKJ09_02308 [Labilithrix luteola]